MGPCPHGIEFPAKDHWNNQIKQKAHVSLTGEKISAYKVFVGIFEGWGY
jgi:hypothetical protein